MDAKKWIQKHKNKVLHVAIILLAAYIALMLYRSQEKNTALLTEKKDLEIKKNAVLTNIGQSKEMFAAYKDLVNKKDVSAIVNTLNIIARDSKVKIISIRPGREQDAPLYTKYTFDLTVHVNNYHTLGKFISNLENHPDVYYVEQANVRPQIQAQEEEPDNLTAELKISTVLLKVENEK